MKNKHHNQPIADFLFALSDLLQSLTAKSFVTADIKSASKALDAWKNAPDEIKEILETHLRKSPSPNLHCVFQLIGMCGNGSGGMVTMSGEIMTLRTIAFEIMFELAEMESLTDRRRQTLSPWRRIHDQVYYYY